MCPNDFFEDFTANGRLLDYDEHGLSWVKEKVNRLFPGANLCKPMIASGFYGAYFEEFDSWKAASPELFKDLTSHQGCLIESNDFIASSCHFESSETILSWSGEPYPSKELSLFIIDRSLILESIDSFYALLVGDEQEIPNVQESSLVRFHEEFFASLKEEYESPISQESKDYIENLLNREDPNGWIKNFVESVTIHFLMGHEFGHYCYRSPNKHLFEESLIKSSVFTKGNSSTLDNETEEIFCDLLGVSNCFFQQSHTLILPSSVIVFVVVWLLSLIDSYHIKNKKLSELMKIRIKAIGSSLENIERDVRLDRIHSRAVRAIPEIVQQYAKDK